MLIDRFSIMARQLAGEPVPPPPAMPGREIRGHIPAGDPIAERWAQQHPDRIEDHAAHCRLVRQAPDVQRQLRCAAKNREKRAAATAQRRLDQQAEAWSEAEREYQRVAMPGFQPPTGAATAQESTT